MDDKAHSHKLLTALLFILCALMAILPPKSFAGAESKKLTILFVSSFAKNLPAQASFESGLDEALGFNQGRHNLFFEFIDNPRLKVENVTGMLATFLDKKYQGIEFDVVVGWGVVAAYFLATHRGLFADAHRMYVDAAGVDLFEGRDQSAKETVVDIAHDHRATLQEVLRLERPQKIYVIGTTTDIEAQTRLKLFKDSLTGEASRIKIEYLLDQTLERVAMTLEGLSRKDAVAFYLLMFSDGNGASLTPYAAVNRIASRSAVPIYSYYDSLMGSGVVGGYVLSIEKVGFELGHTILCLSNGEALSGISPMRHVYDWKALQRWHIAENNLSEGAVVLNRPPDLLARYRWHMLAAVILIIALSSLSFFLSKALSRSKRAEAALSLSEANLKSAQEVARIGGFIFDVPKNSLAWSEGTADVFGMPVETKLSYRDFLRIVHPDDRDDVDATWQAALKGSSADIEYRVIDGAKLKWIRSKVTVEFDRKSRPLLVKGVFQDISERKKSEEEAARLRYDLAHVTRVATVGELGQNIAHEVSQPLTAIAANAEAALRLLKESQPDMEEVREALGDIVSDQKRAQEVVRRIRTLVKKDRPDTVRVDLNSLARDAVQVVQGDAMVRDARIFLDLADGPPTVWGDPVQLQQVVINLLVNALDAVDREASSLRRITVATSCESAHAATLSVSDTGVGIDAETTARLFEPFFTTKSQGLGLGLSISRSIVEAHGGTIRVAANTDGGATFHVILPRAAPECADGQRATYPATGG